MTKLFIATPAYSGKLDVPYVISLCDTRTHLLTKSCPVSIIIRTSGSFLPKERNRLLSQFLATDCTHILCIDSDISWPPECVYSMIQRDLDFLGICYLTKGQNYFSGIPKFHMDGSLIEKDGLIQMLGIPAGFMLIKRHVIEKMCEHYKHLSYDTDGPGDIPGVALFNSELIDRKLWGEDIVFCKRAVDAGFEIWTDPDIELSHGGSKARLRNALTKIEGKHG